MAMKSVQVRFPEEELARIDQYVENGEYPSRSEFVRDAVRRSEMIRSLTRLRELAEEEDISLEELVEEGKEERQELYREMFGEK